MSIIKNYSFLFLSEFFNVNISRMKVKMKQEYLQKVWILLIIVFKYSFHFILFFQFISIYLYNVIKFELQNNIIKYFKYLKKI